MRQSFFSNLNNGICCVIMEALALVNVEVVPWMDFSWKISIIFDFCLISSF